VPWLHGATKVETGSSYAAPLIAGKIARLLSGIPGIDPAGVKPLLSVLADRRIDVI
jgi:subtilisin family serine protease